MTADNRKGERPNAEAQRKRYREPRELLLQGLKKFKIYQGRNITPEVENVSLNIKDRETHKLAQRLAQETGETMTKAVSLAIKEKLTRVRRAKRSKATAEELRAITRRFRSHLKGEVEDHGTFLYDEKGLPK